MIIGEGDLAPVVTPKTRSITQKDGTVVTKEYWEALYPPTAEVLRDVQETTETPQFEYDSADFLSPPPEQSYNPTVRLHYI